MRSGHSKWRMTAVFVITLGRRPCIKWLTLHSSESSRGFRGQAVLVGPRQRVDPQKHHAVGRGTRGCNMNPGQRSAVERRRAGGRRSDRIRNADQRFMILREAVAASQRILLRRRFAAFQRRDGRAHTRDQTGNDDASVAVVAEGAAFGDGTQRTRGLGRPARLPTLLEWDLTGTAAGVGARVLQ